MMKLLTSWQTFWHHDVFMTSWRIFDVTNCLTSCRMLHLLTSWRTFWRIDTLFDLMTNFLCSWHIYFIISGTKYNENVFLMLWQTFWCHDMFLMSCMMNFLTSWHIFDFITNFLTSWRIFHFISNCWCIFDVMRDLLKSWRVFDVMACFNVMTNLTPWRMFWRHDVFLTSWTFWHHDALLDVMTSLSWVDNINILHNQIHTNISEWWCGQTLLGRYYVCPNTTTHHTIMPM